MFGKMKEVFWAKKTSAKSLGMNFMHPKILPGLKLEGTFTLTSFG